MIDDWLQLAKNIQKHFLTNVNISTLNHRFRARRIHRCAYKIVKGHLAALRTLLPDGVCYQLKGNSIARHIPDSDSGKWVEDFSTSI